MIIGHSLKAQGHKKHEGSCFSLFMMGMCRLQGYDPSELIFKSKQDLKIEMGNMFVDNDILELRWKAYEDRRKVKIKNVMAERKNVIKQQSST